MSARRARQQPRSVPRCPDCNAVGSSPQPGAWSPGHASICPIALEIDCVTDLDREWFEAHPGENERHRRAVWGEIQEGYRGSAALGRRFPAEDVWVGVMRVAPGVRFRHFYAAVTP